MRSEVREIIKNSFYLYLVQGLNFLLPLITLPYLLSTLSTDSFGKYSFAFAFSQFIILFVDFGFNLSATKKIAENYLNKKLVKDIFWRVNFIKIFFLIFSFILTIVLIQIFDKIFFYREGILVSYIMVLGTAIFPIWWFQGLNKMKILSVISAISKLLTYPLIFIFVKSSNDSNYAIFFQSLSIFSAGLLSILYIIKYHNNYFINIQIGENLKDYFLEIKDAWPIFLSNSSISLYTNSLTLLLGFFSTTFNVGLFGAMERIVRVICFGILGPVNQACFPILVRAKKENFEKAKKIFQIVLLTIIIILLIVFVLFILFENYILINFMKGYNDVKVLLFVFMLMIFPIAIGGVLGQLGLLGLGNEFHKKIFSKIYIIIGIISIPISLIMIKLYEVKGAMISMMTVETLIFIVLLYYIKKFKFI